MKRSTLGIILLAFPLPLLLVTMSGYAITSFMFSSLADAGDPEEWARTGNIIALLLQIVGVAALLGFFIGMPVGAYLLFTGSKGKK